MSDDKRGDAANSDDNLASQALAVVDNLAPSGWKLKLAKATAQLLVGTRAGAAVYAEAREHLDEIEGRSAMNKALYAVATKQVLEDPEMVERAKARLIGGILSKQENLEAVIDGASDRVRALPAPENASEPPQQEPDGSTASGETTDQPLNTDWAAEFTQVAENATSDELRDRLSRLLAGEISSKGTFPRSTIRAIADLEKADLDALIAVLPYTYGTAILQDEVANKRNLEVLKECGIADYNPSFGMTTNLTLDTNGPGGFLGDKWTLFISASAPVTFSFAVAPLTRVGRAVLTLLDGYSERQTLVSLADRLDKTGVTSIAIGTYKLLPDGKARIHNSQVIYPAPSYKTITQPNYQTNPFRFGQH